MLNINLNEVKENSIEIRERKASSAATINGLNKRRLDLPVSYTHLTLPTKA